MYVKIKKFIPKKIFKLAQPIYHFILSFMASVFYGNPSKKIIVIGVTGTTGKTTIVYLIAKMLQNAGFKTGYTSTAMFGDGDNEWLNDKKMTMPGRFFAQKILNQMVKNKCQFAIIETTSEGIVQFRHKFINYDIVLFTGLYPEHIESHGSFKNYKKAKGQLFAHLKKCKTKFFKKCNLPQVKKTIIVNGDDKHADYFLNFWSERKYQLSINNKQSPVVKNTESILIKSILTSSQGTNFKINNTTISLKLLGEFNVINTGLVYCAGLASGLKIKQIKKGLESISGVPGRLEKINKGQNFTVIVDYAYEPNAVLKLYKTIQKIKYNKIIHVLGSAGGGRDSDRRVILGKIAGEKANFVIITNEDPYDEDPKNIIKQVTKGALQSGKVVNNNLFAIEERRQAIKKAFSLAKENDIILITGKGCEQAICIANEKKIKWDDRKVAREELEKMTNQKI